MADYENIDLENSVIFDNSQPLTLLQRILAVKQLIFSKTRLEFRLVWNKVFQTQDDELGWLLDPHRRDKTEMKYIRTSGQDPVYYYNYSDSPSVTVYKRKTKRKENKSLSKNALQIARYMGMGAYMSSTAFPSPFVPRCDYVTNNQYSVETIW